MMDTYPLLLAATLQAGTVLALASLGLLINEKAGVINLGAEGMMLCSALAGFAVVVHTGSDSLGLLAGMVVGGGMALLLGLLVVGLNANPYATGLALSLLGAGLSAFLGTPYVQARLPERISFGVPLLQDLPWIGPAFFQHHPLVYAAIGLALGLMWWLDHTRSGLVLRSIGESPAAAHALGYPVRTLRLLAVCAGGGLCGLAGAYVSLVYTPLWVEGMIAGKGWIALALTTFATWRPMRILLGAYLFGGVTMLQFHWQASGVELPSQWLSMLPYLATIVVLAVLSRRPAWMKTHMPLSLGKPFHPDQP